MPERRKAFNFYRSYYDILQELPEENQLSYLKAIIEMQFTGKEPKGLKGMAKFAFISQKHSLIKQLQGYIHGIKGGAPPKEPPKEPPKGKGNQVQVQGEEQEKGKVEYRKGEFKNSLSAHLEKYGKEMLNDFFAYWTEKSPKGKKMRFEMEKVFDHSRRLQNWERRNKNQFNSKTNPEGPKYEEL